jgi:hypothetical protein
MDTHAEKEHEGLTTKQAQALAFIQARRSSTGRAPSYREIAAHRGVTDEQPTSMCGRWKEKGPSPQPGATVASV